MVGACLGNGRNIAAVPTLHDIDYEADKTDGVWVKKAAQRQSLWANFHTERVVAICFHHLTLFMFNTSVKDLLFFTVLVDSFWNLVGIHSNRGQLDSIDNRGIQDFEAVDFGS